MHKQLTSLLCAALAVIASGCQRDAPMPMQTPAETAASTAFADGQQAWRKQRLDDLLKPDGWASLIGLHWIEPGSHYVGSNDDNGIRLAMGSAQFGMIDRNAGQVRLVPNKDAVLTLDGEPLRSATALKTDADEAGPSIIGFDEGRGIATVIKRGERYALRVKHADAPSRVQFAGLDYWPADPSWVIEAKYVANPPDKTIEIANIIGTVDKMANPGVVEFQRDGKTWRIEALYEGGDELFLVFADRTNGHGSYGAGRFLDAPMPDAEGRMILDFNRSYSPPCAFTAFATCPLPPKENRLDLAITAGEKAYSIKPH